MSSLWLGSYIRWLIISGYLHEPVAQFLAVRVAVDVGVPEQAFVAWNLLRDLNFELHTRQRGKCCNLGFMKPQPIQTIMIMFSYYPSE